MPGLTGLDFDENTGWEIEQKGWCSLVRLELDDGRVLPLNFWDPVRLAQDLAMHFAQGNKVFAEVNIIVLPTLTKEAMREAALKLVKQGYFDT